MGSWQRRSVRVVIHCGYINGLPERKEPMRPPLRDSGEHRVGTGEQPPIILESGKRAQAL